MVMGSYRTQRIDQSAKERRSEVEPMRSDEEPARSFVAPTRSLIEPARGDVGPTWLRVLVSHVLRKQARAYHVLHPFPPHCTERACIPRDTYACGWVPGAN